MRGICIKKPFKIRFFIVKKRINSKGYQVYNESKGKETNRLGKLNKEKLHKKMRGD